MLERRSDWLRIVYGTGREAEGFPQQASRTGILVRQVPATVHLEPDGREQRIRVTVIPSEAGAAWTLNIRDLGPGPDVQTSRGVWWRVEPGTWQPLGRTRECVASARGRMLLDVSVRWDPTDRDLPPPRLRFAAEPA